MFLQAAAPNPPFQLSPYQPTQPDIPHTGGPDQPGQAESISESPDKVVTCTAGSALLLP